MATLTGRIADVTDRVPENIVNVTVKAPTARVGGTGVVTSSPATVDYNQTTGELTITGIDNGLSWLVIEGVDWTDHVSLAVSDGFTLVVEAIANALGAPGMADYLALLDALENKVDDIANDLASSGLSWQKASVSDVDSATTPGAWHTHNQTTGLPEDMTSGLGVLEVFKVASSFTQRWTSWGLSSQVWVRSYRLESGTWYPWRSVTDFDKWGHDRRVADVDLSTQPGVWQTDNDTVGLPEDKPTGLGTLEVVKVLSAYTQRWTSWGLYPKTYVRSMRGADDWYPWSPLVPEVEEPEAPTQGSAGGLKTVPLALTTGHGNSNNGPASGSFRVPIKYNASIVRWRLALSNRNPRFANIHRTTATISKIVIGKDNGNGKLSAPVTVGSNLTVPDTGDVAYTKWVNRPITEAMLLAFKYTSTGTDTPPRLLGGGWDVDTADPANTSVTGTRVSYLPFDMWLEVETQNSTPVVAAFGDSLSSGANADLPVFDSWLSQYARRIGALPIHYTHSGDSASSWASDFDSYKWRRWRHLHHPDAVIYQLGSNDLSASGDNTPVLQDNTTAILEWVAKDITPNIYAGTITPRTSWDSATDSERTTYNTWLNTLPAGIRDVFDVASAIGNGADIKPEYDADGTHLNTAGYLAWADAIDRPIVTMPETERERSTLAADTDLDTLTERGIHNATFNMVDWQAQHYPGNLKGLVVVDTIQDATFCIQHFYSRSNLSVPAVFYRFMTSAGWSPWVTLTP